MNSDFNEIILRNKPNREPMSFERLKFLCYFSMQMTAMVLGFALAFVFFFGMFGVFE